MLEYGYRSRCCREPVRINKVKKNNIYQQVWQCVKCRKSGIDIIPTSDLQSQGENDIKRPFSDID